MENEGRLSLSPNCTKLKVTHSRANSLVSRSSTRKGKYFPSPYPFLTELKDPITFPQVPLHLPKCIKVNSILKVEFSQLSKLTSNSISLDYSKINISEDLPSDSPTRLLKLHPQRQTLKYYRIRHNLTPQTSHHPKQTTETSTLYLKGCQISESK